MNQKVAKALRQVAGYRNQSATPGRMPFPGVARFYQHPVFERRERTVKSFDPTTRTYTQTVKQSLVVDRRGRPTQVMDLVPVDPADPGKGQTLKPKIEMVPVSKPGRLDKCPKRWYRMLKRHVHVHGLRRVNEALAQVMEFVDGQPRLNINKLSEVLK